MQGGYMGKALDVDLSKGTIQELTIDPADRDTWCPWPGLLWPLRTNTGASLETSMSTNKATG